MQGTTCLSVGVERGLTGLGLPEASFERLLEMEDRGRLEGRVRECWECS